MGGRRGHEPGRLLSLAATLMLLARRSTEDPPERREAIQRPRAGLLLRAPHHSSQRMALRYFTLSSSLCAETIGGAWEVRLEKNMERVRAMVSISFYLYEVGSARAPKGFPWWTAGMKIDPRVPNTLIRKDYSIVNFTNIYSVSTQIRYLSKPQKWYSFQTESNQTLTESRLTPIFDFILEKPATRPRDRCGKEQLVYPFFTGSPGSSRVSALAP